MRIIVITVNGPTGAPSAFDHAAASTAKVALQSIGRPNEDAATHLIGHFPHTSGDRSYLSCIRSQC